MQAESEKLLPLGDHWSRSEVDETAFRDPRLRRRFGDLLCRLSDKSLWPVRTRRAPKPHIGSFPTHKVEEGDILRV